MRWSPRMRQLRWTTCAVSTTSTWGSTWRPWRAVRDRRLRERGRHRSSQRGQRHPDGYRWQRDDDIQVERSTLANNGGDGFRATAGASLARAFATLTRNSIDQNGQNGILANGVVPGMVTVYATENSVNANAGTGIFSTSSGGPGSYVSASGNTGTQGEPPESFSTAARTGRYARPATTLNQPFRRPIPASPREAASKIFALNLPCRATRVLGPGGSRHQVFAPGIVVRDHHDGVGLVRSQCR